jgi:NAD(P)H-dependent flavin oxidoreductase YrpB (nitropropane dioxygenase family)
VEAFQGRQIQASLFRYPHDLFTRIPCLILSFYTRKCALAKKALKIPFLLSGGVANGSQLLAALALGAAGVQIGTRFNATIECSKFGSSYKEAMLKAGKSVHSYPLCLPTLLVFLTLTSSTLKGPTDSIIVMSSFNASSRVLKTKEAQAILQIEQSKGGKAGVMAGKLTFQDIAKYAMV